MIRCESLKITPAAVRTLGRGKAGWREGFAAAPGRAGTRSGPGDADGRAQDVRVALCSVPELKDVQNS